MLSTENPPPDPSDETPSKLKSGNSDFVSSDEKAYLDVDLLKSGLDDTNQTLPKFSIRDYVFSTRSKDIKTHWPFSSKNLQLCLKHGVKNVLPPFETLHSVRNPSSTVKCADEDTSNCSDVGQKLVTLETENIESNSPEEDKELYPSTARSLSCSDVNPVPSRTKSPFLEPEADNLPGSSIEKPEFAVRAHKVKTNNIAQNQAKKCKLIVKLGHNVSEPKSNEDLPLEAMASKVCPVCKTFSSSSNTTLNAHIDQCLSGESTIKWTEKENSKVIKHRIKPRKTRLMADIYLTALSCTLEDLDRRNGTNWATNLGFQAQDIEAYSEEKSNKTTHCSTTIDKNEEGAVYFDSNGTKLRILSKFNNVQPNRNGEDGCGPRELTKREKGNKVISSKKKNKYVVQRHKLPKSPPFEQRSCSLRPDRCLEVNNAQEMNFPPEEETEKEDLAQPLKACDHPTKSNDSGMIKQWVSSKRTGHKKKKHLENKSQNPYKTVKNLRSKSHLILPDDKLIKRTSDSIFRISPDDNSLSATESHKRNKKYTPFNSDDEHMERQTCQTNRSEFSLLDARDCDKKNQTMPSKSNIKRLKEKGPTFSRSNKKMRSISSTVNVDRSFISSGLSKHHSFSSEVKKLSPLSKNPLSIRRASVSESNKLLGKKRLDFKKPRLHHTFESHEEAFGRSEIRTQNNPSDKAARVEKDSCNSSIDRARVLKIRKKRWGFVNTDKDGGASLNHSNASSESNSHGLDRNIDSFMGDDEIQDGFVSEPISNIAFGKSLAYEGHCSRDVVLSGEQEMDKAGEEMAEEVDVNELEGNYFVDVDPIPIPGPPGSFLPSPGRMASEELQGNSSLTTCRIHSSEDERELIDMDSSDSPISDTSFLSKSNSMLPLRSHESQHHMFENRTDRVLERSVSFEPKIDESRGKLIIPETNFPIPGDCESPSVSTPVLRLMGKNLMVMSKEENLSPQNRPTQSSTVHDFSNLSSSNIISSSIAQNEHRPFYHNLFRGPPMLGNSQTCTLAQQRFDFMNSSIGSSSVIRSNFETPELSRHPSRVMLSNELPRSSLEHRDYAGGYVFTHDRHLGSTVRSDYPIRTTDSNCGGKCKEIIVIDDSPENEAKILALKMGYRYNIEAGGSSAGFSESRHVTNPVYGYPMRCYPFSSGPQMSLNAKTQLAPPFNGSNGNSVNWNIRAPDGPSALHRDSFTASSPSTGHQKSPLYFSHPGFPSPAHFM